MVMIRKFMRWLRREKSPEVGISMADINRMYGFRTPDGSFDAMEIYSRPPIGRTNAVINVSPLPPRITFDWGEFGGEVPAVAPRDPYIWRSTEEFDR